MKQRNSKRNNPLAGFDFFIVLIILALAIVGIIFIANAKSGPYTGEEQSFKEVWDKIDFYYPKLQIRWFAIGLVLMIMVCLFDYHTYAALVEIGLLIATTLLVFVLVFNVVTRGIAGWIYIGSVGFQPSEITKVLIIVFTAKYAARAVDTNQKITINRDFLITMAIIAVPTVLVVVEPDAGTAFVYIIILAGILFSARISWKLIIVMVFLGVAALAIMFFSGMMDAYQQARFLNFFGITEPATLESMGIDPDILEKYTHDQAMDALRAIGAGGFTGKGFFAPSSFVQLGYLPAGHTDFIFASGIEAVGLIGGLGVMALYALLLGRALFHGFTAKDNLGYFITVGVVSMELAHIFENIGMNIGLMPITGIPLPFISYGGSSMWTNMLAFGLVINVAMRKPGKRYRGNRSMVE